MKSPECQLDQSLDFPKQLHLATVWIFKGYCTRQFSTLPNFATAWIFPISLTCPMFGFSQTAPLGNVSIFPDCSKKILPTYYQTSTLGR
jgi:hypothetical protein